MTADVFLTLERKDQEEDGILAGGAIMITPSIGEDYWSYRVGVAEQQAVLGFPKFNTIGIGFEQEEDWNTNLPYTCEAEEILEHIWHNAGPGIQREHVLEAIRMIQAAAKEDRP